MNVSVIIPSYNAARYIAQAIQSVLAQSYKNHEVIVVDDGSTDETAEIVRSFDDQRVRYLYIENRGNYFARNLGIQHANGQYIAFLDADDIWLPQMLERQLELIEKGFWLTTARYYQFSDEDLDNLFVDQSHPNPDQGTEGRGFLEALITKNVVSTSATTARRECFDKLGGFDTTHHNGMDYDMWLRIASHYPCAASPDRLLLRRVHERNISRNLVGMGKALLYSYDKILSGENRGPFIDDAGLAKIRDVRARESYLLGLELLVIGEYNEALRYLRSGRTPGKQIFRLFAMIAAGLRADFLGALIKRYRTSKRTMNLQLVSGLHVEYLVDGANATFPKTRHASRVMRRIRVLHLIKTLRMGGAEANLLNLILATNPLSTEVHVGYSLGGELEYRFLRAGARLFRYACAEHKVKSPASFIIILRIWKYIRKHKIEAVHTHNFSGHIWGLLAAKLAGVPVVEHVHDHRYTPHEEFLRRKGEGTQFRFTRYFKKRSDRIIVLTKHQREFALKNGFARSDQVLEIQNGISVENGIASTQDLNAIRYSIGISPESQVILTTARIDEAKNIDLILRTAAIVSKDAPHALFIISGDGPLLHRYRTASRQMGLEHAVRFIGFYEEVKELLRISHVFLLPSLLELHSVSTLEAMMSGVPVVVSKGVGCNDEFLVSWENGVLLDPFSESGWAEAIVSLLNDEALRIRIGRAGQRTCAERFDISNVAQRIERIYAELCHK